MHQPNNVGVAYIPAKCANTSSIMEKLFPQICITGQLISLEEGQLYWEKHNFYLFIFSLNLVLRRIEWISGESQ